MTDRPKSLVMKPLTDDAIINYQVALSKIGDFQQPFLMELLNEQKKSVPDQLIILRAQKILDKLASLRILLKYTDTDKVESILRGNTLATICEVD